MINKIVKELLPEKAVRLIRKIRRTRRRARVGSLPVLTQKGLKEIFAGPLQLRAGDVVVIHSSLGNLNLGFPYDRILSLIREIVGDEGTLLFPTYPMLTSYKFLLSGEVFDIRKSPSYTGILSEFARQHKAAIRSLHPTKSVCAIGPQARELTETHQHSLHPCDTFSPFYKIMKYNARVIGLGVSTQQGLSPVHTVEDALIDDFPVDLYHKRLFAAKCINYDGKIEIVHTYGHKIENMKFQVPRFMAGHVPADIGSDMTIHGMKFFRADVKKIFDLMVDLARKGITVYPKSCYKREWR